VGLEEPDLLDLVIVERRLDMAVDEVGVIHCVLPASTLGHEGERCHIGIAVHGR
jgi:hypothetical protein